MRKKPIEHESCNKIRLVTSTLLWLLFTETNQFCPMCYIMLITRKKNNCRLWFNIYDKGRKFILMLRVWKVNCRVNPMNYLYLCVFDENCSAWLNSVWFVHVNEIIKIYTLRAVSLLLWIRMYFKNKNYISRSHFDMTIHWFLGQNHFQFCLCMNYIESIILFFFYTKECYAYKDLWS